MQLINAEVITIGDEILFGQITDTNTQWISAEIDKIGIKTVRKSSVGDTREDIVNVLNESLKRADVVFFTGGLGPTKDDITKHTLAAYFNDELVINKEAEAFIKDFFEKRGREFTEINRQQAAIPSKCTYLPNKTGTAPGMWFEHEGKIIVSMPGVPNEMKYLMTYEVIPRLKEYFKTPIITHKIIRTIGIGESFLAEKISDWEDSLPSHIKLAYLPSFGQVKLRLTGYGDDFQVLADDIDAQAEKLRPIIAEFIYSFDNQELEESLGTILTENHETVAVAESCTGGYLSHLFTSVSGSSAYFMGGVVSYSNEAKMNVLSVKQETLENFGAVSEQTVTEMAEGVRKLMNTTYGIATSGIAGPGGGSEEKPVGTIWIAVSGPEGTIARKFLFMGQRSVNIQYGSVTALNMLRKLINRTLA
ncbi:competence/damage-inducible protein A [Emticicia sp. CRIBPO]|uniref:competence/damage-inducible protein A n=1 Tax=Emticicia sp. CRIBPO TaxID=2683258 RepID=UPI001412CD09|nr:competence/damage-inducible protein A [Emticicia sp. CRIBPO]NBA84290.1 competence/damage-inducible protein A [Emticicia sp. CRIBPO]